MATFSQTQLEAYFERIHFAQHRHAPRSLQFVASLVRHQLVYVPFETLGLHYSEDKKISLDPEVLYQKIVVRKRGGYCLENNAFFGIVLRSLGFAAYGVVCRITAATIGATDGSWRAMSHMANIVFLDGKKYMVDVGFGADGPSLPLPLESTAIADGLPEQYLQLKSKTLPQHTDPEQKVWVYSVREGDAGRWREIYHFHEQEFFASDFDVLNHYNMTIGRFTKVVVAQRFTCVPAGPDAGLNGIMLLSQNRFVKADWPVSNHVNWDRLRTEAYRIGVLEEHFALVLDPQEQAAICGGEAELIE